MEVLSLTALSPGTRPAPQAPRADGRAADSVTRSDVAVEKALQTGPSAMPAAPRKAYEVSLDVDKRINRIIVTIKHPDTGEVIEQLPPEQIRNIAAEIRDQLAPIVDKHV